MCVGGPAAPACGQDSAPFKGTATADEIHVRMLSSYPWIAAETGVVNQYYCYCAGEDFGPFFLKFCSYFPFNAKLASTATNGPNGRPPRPGSAAPRGFLNKDLRPLLSEYPRPRPDLAHRPRRARRTGLGALAQSRHHLPGRHRRPHPASRNSHLTSPGRTWLSLAGFAGPSPASDTFLTSIPGIPRVQPN
jgi:hypothetical protein